MRIDTLLGLEGVEQPSKLELYNTVNIEIPIILLMAKPAAVSFKLFASWSREIRAVFVEMEDSARGNSPQNSPT